MAVPTWTSGQVLTASDVNTWFVPLAAVKPSDESVTSSTTLQNDDDLFMTVGANSTYLVFAMLYATGASTGDLKIAFNGPASATFFGAVSGMSAGGTASTDDLVANMEIGDGAAGTFGVSGGVGTPRPVTIHGTLIVAGTSGTFRLRWAQGTSDATSTVLKLGSSLVLFRIA